MVGGSRRIDSKVKTHAQVGLELIESMKAINTMETVAVAKQQCGNNTGAVCLCIVIRFMFRSSLAPLCCCPKLAIVGSNWICPPAHRLSNTTAWLSGKFQAKPAGGGRGSVAATLFHMALTDPFEAQAVLFVVLDGIRGAALRETSQWAYGAEGSERIDTIESGKERELCPFIAPIARERSS